VAADELGEELREGMDCSLGAEVVLDCRWRKGKEKEGRR
jgi:hypothetical protein